MLNPVTHAFLERWFKFRNQERDLLWGKLGVAFGIGGMNGMFPAANIENLFMYSFIETVASVYSQGVASCFTCGYVETCAVGMLEMKIKNIVVSTKKKNPQRMR
ncbi:MAG: hypothetical protein PF482_18915 [Desulfobacteraceae bacterium]|jgi:hypothetical protein|nr:hypothetical protein [Desulfobacteraceae bacterium]